MLLCAFKATITLFLSSTMVTARCQLSVYLQRREASLILHYITHKIVYWLFRYVTKPVLAFLGD